MTSDNGQREASSQPGSACGSAEHWSRRAVLRGSAAAGVGWLTGLAGKLAMAEEKQPRGKPARSLIMIWLAGGPSQLETFDPKPDSAIAYGTRAIETSARGVQLAAGYERLAEQMKHVALVRSVTSKEGDHERGTYTVKTGYRPDPTLIHPTIGAVWCHELPAGGTEIPRHVSILPGQWPAWGGYLGNTLDAFKTGDPKQKVPDVTARVDDDRMRRRLADLDVVEQAFARGRKAAAEATAHRATVAAARQMMTSQQLAAFDVSQESTRVREAFGDTAFGRGCLAARRLIGVGVRCVEITLGGWDTHTGNHEAHTKLAETLDPALAALLADLTEHKLLGETVVVCGGEFGRTPRLNALEGRDHWPHGFTIALAGGGIRGGSVVGETDPEGGRHVQDPHSIEDIHATVLSALGIDGAKELDTPIGRPMKLSAGKPIAKLL